MSQEIPRNENQSPLTDAKFEHEDAPVKEEINASPSSSADIGMGPMGWLFGLGAVPEASQLKPVPPSKDAWYAAPVGYESKAPGDVLRVRPAPRNLKGIMSNAKAIHHILYRTTDSRYKPSWAVTTLIIPQFFYFSPSGKAALLSIQLAYNTANLDSSPSVDLFGRLAEGNADIGTSSATAFINLLLSQGWMVNTPDHWGPTAAFGATVQAGHATLDSIRAVLNLANMTGTAEITTAMWGYSGGSMATMAGAELQARYAPDLQLAGAVLGGLVDDISADFDHVNKTVLAGTLIAFLLGLTSQYPEAKAYLESRLLPNTKDEFLSVRHIHVADAVTKFAGKDISSYFEGGVLDLQVPILRKLYNAQVKLGYKGVPAMPMFVYKAIGDQFCPIDQTDVTVERLRNGGAEITYQRNAAGEHVSEIENGKPRAMKWLWSVFDESYQPPAAGCVIRDVNVDASTKDGVD